jgi:7-keto-8-aminopelargonate synthetase-like enzyme
MLKELAQLLMLQKVSSKFVIVGSLFSMNGGW